MLSCKNCTKRHRGCHDTCEIHLAELAEYKAKKDFIYSRNELERFLFDVLGPSRIRGKA